MAEIKSSFLMSELVKDKNINLKILVVREKSLDHF